MTEIEKLIKKNKELDKEIIKKLEMILKKLNC